MTIYGVDLHPKYQGGISLRRVRDEGFRFAIVKMSEATNSASYSGSRAWVAQARQLGMHVGGYHYLRAGNIAAQVDTFCAALEAAGNPAAMLDVEEGSGNMAGVLDFLGRCAQRGHPIRMLYMPRWYWQQIGQPSLAGLPPLWSSRYASMNKGLASALYQATPGSFWGGYGGGRVACLQFSSSALVASYVIDVNAFEGTDEQLAALFGGAVGPAPVIPPTPKVKPVVQNYPVIGRGVIELNTMIKGASRYYGEAFVSVRSTQAGHVDIWWGMSGKGGRGEVHWDLAPNARRWTELTGGDVDQTTVHFDMGTWKDAAGAVHPADGVISVEFGPK